jgi:hypothetical protein
MSRRKQRLAKKKNLSPSAKRHEARQRALRKIPLHQVGLKGDDIVAKYLRRQTMSVLMGFAKSMPDNILDVVRIAPYIRYGFQNFFADDLFIHLSRLLVELFPRTFPMVTLNSKGIEVFWGSMRSEVTADGTQFIPGTVARAVPVMYRGVAMQPRFTRHAISRILERIHMDPKSWHAHDRTFRRIHLQTGALVPWVRNEELKGFALWDATPHDPRFDHAIQACEVDDAFPFLDLERPPTFKVWRLIGYLPCEVSGTVAVCKTLLYPGMRETPEQKCGIENSLVELNAGELSTLSDAQQIKVLKQLHAASPQFRFFTAEEAKQAGNTWIEECKPSDRNRFVSRRRSNLFRQMEENMKLKESA